MEFALNSQENVDVHRDGEDLSVMNLAPKELTEKVARKNATAKIQKAAITSLDNVNACLDTEEISANELAYQAIME